MAIKVRDFEVRLTRNKEERKQVRQLRYKVFVEEEGANTTEEQRALGEEYDAYDRYAEYMAVFHNGRVVGTYRIIDRNAAEKMGGFYTENEFNISKIKKYNDFVSIGIDFAMLNILLLTIYSFTITHGYANNNWYIKIAIPIVFAIYLFLNILVAVRFLKINRLLKTSIILFLIDILYFIVPFIKFNNSNAQEEIDKVNIFKADLGHWKGETPLENNIHCIIFLTIMTLSIIFFIAGLIRHIKRKNQNKV